MEKSDSIPTLWRQQSPKWARLDDSQQKFDLPSLHRSFGSKPDIYQIIKHWPIATEKYMFFLGVGGQIAVGATGALALCRSIQDSFVIRGAAATLMCSYTAAAFTTGFIFGLNDYVTVSNIFRGRQDYCFTCTQTQQALANVAAAAIFPAITLAPLNMYLAARDPSYGTSVPVEVKRGMQFVWDRYKGAVLRRIQWVALANVIAAYIGTYLEMKAATRISLLAEDDPSLLKIPERTHGRFSKIQSWIADRMTR